MSVSKHYIFHCHRTENNVNTAKESYTVMNFYKETKILCYTIPFFNALADHIVCHFSHLRQFNVPYKLKRNHGIVTSIYLLDINYQLKYEKYKFETVHIVS